MSALRKSQNLVTGGAGFIEPHPVRLKDLLSQGASVTVYDNLCFGRTKNLSDIKIDIRLTEGDI